MGSHRVRASRTNSNGMYGTCLPQSESLVQIRVNWRGFAGTSLKGDSFRFSFGPLSVVKLLSFSNLRVSVSLYLCGETFPHSIIRHCIKRCG